ncbi:MAG: LysM peptidoglycan-binding domain-containing protein [Clostridia bacterium]|nr:LysM peptidoglycan-binding domain-containing protein [Clostridia bacterium]
MTNVIKNIQDSILWNKLTIKGYTPAICGVEERKAYRRRRTLKKQLFRVIVLSSVLTLLTGSMLFALAKEPYDTSVSYTTVTVQSGDTLWTIAKENFPGEDPRDVINEIRALNDISGFTIYAGETISLPNDI